MMSPRSSNVVDSVSQPVETIFSAAAACSLPPPGRARRARLFEAVDALVAGDLIDAHLYTRPFAEFFPSTLAAVGAGAKKPGGSHESAKNEADALATNPENEQQPHDSTPLVPLSEAMLLGSDVHVFRVPPLLSSRVDSRSHGQTHVPSQSEAIIWTKARRERTGTEMPRHGGGGMRQPLRRRRQQQPSQQPGHDVNRVWLSPRANLAGGDVTPLFGNQDVTHAKNSHTDTNRTTSSSREAGMRTTAKTATERRGTRCDTGQLQRVPPPRCVQVLPMPGSHVGVALPPPLEYVAPPVRVDSSSSSKDV
jgi:hypothetical protein